MSNEKLKTIFIKHFKLKKKIHAKKINNKDIKKWDSIEHLNIIMKIENIFKVKFTFDEIIKSNNYELICKILKSK